MQKDKKIIKEDNQKVSNTFKINNEAMINEKKGRYIDTFQRPKILNAENKYAYDSYTNLDIDYLCGLDIYDDLLLDGTEYKSYPLLNWYMKNGLINQICSTLADDCVKVWGEIRSKSNQDKSEYIKRINNRIDELDLKNIMKKAMVINLTQGGAMVYPKLRNDEKELDKELLINNTKIKKGMLEYFNVITPLNCSPLQYNSINPLLNNYYEPDIYIVGTNQVHKSRLFKMVYMHLPNIISPQYNMFGLPLVSVLSKYISNFERTRDEICAIVKKYNVNVLKTDLRRILFEGASPDGLRNRAHLFNNLADNSGLFALDYETEDFEQVSMNLSNLEAILWQQAHLICSISGLSVTKLWGTSSKGLNATGEGDQRNYYDKIDAMRVNNLLVPINKSIDIIQLDIFGEIDSDLEFVFNPLWQMDDKDLSQIQLNRATQNEKYVSIGAIDAEDVRSDLMTNPESGYNHLGEREHIESDGIDDNAEEE